MNRPKAMDDETRKASEELAKQQKQQETKLITGLNGETKSINEGYTRKATIVFKDNKNCKFTVDNASTKVLIESCNDSEIRLNGRINTEVVEIWNCENTTLILGTKVKTLQADLSKNLTLQYSEKANFNQIVWAGVHNFDVKIGSENNLQTGVEKVDRTEIPDFKENFDQFIIRFVKGKLVEELIVRLNNGFPTTEREAAAFDEQKEKNDKLYEDHVRKMISTKTNGITDKLDKLSKVEAKKVGRNDPCKCGSGKKFKKCCEGKGVDEQTKKQLEEARAEIAKIDEKEKKKTDEVKAIAETLLPKDDAKQ